jgi:hypothetical protein
MQLSALQGALPSYAAGFTIPTSVNAISWKTIDACSMTTNCAHGSYTWTGAGSFDALVTSIIGTCTTCKIGIIVQPASDSSPDSATPLYVTSSAWASNYTCGLSPCNPVDQISCTSSSSVSPYSGQPAFWEPPGLAAYQLWAQEVVRHFTNYDSHSATYWSQVSYVRFGLFIGGEATIPCPYETTTNYSVYNLTPQVASAYVSALFSSITALNPTFKVQGPMYGGDGAIYPGYCSIGLGTSGVCITQAYPDAEAAAEVGSGAGIGAESLGMNDVNWYAQGQVCLGDACGLFNTYAWAAPIFDWQTYKYSDPTCNPWESTATCPTGSLVNLLPFATVRMHVGENPNRLNALEIFWDDWMCAYTSSPPTTCPLAPDPYYQTALSNAALGQPNATSAVIGNVSVSGAATIY